MEHEILERGCIRVTGSGPVVTVTLDRADARNAQTPAMWAALASVGRHLPATARVVILRAEGPSFSAGLDRRMFTPVGIPGEPSLLSLAAAADSELDEAIGRFQDAFTWWRACDAITIAAVQGHAVGAGFQLALACDLIVVDPSARFSMKETSLGLVPDLAGTSPLVEAVGYSRALEICATGREVDAAEAVALGIAVAAAGTSGLDAAVETLVAPILAAPPGAVTETKHLLRGAQHRHPVDQRAQERAAQARRLRDLAAGLGRDSSGERA